MMQRLPRTTWIPIVITGILAMLATVMANAAAPAFAWLSPRVALVLFVLISLTIIGVSLWRERQKAASSGSENRQIMLSRVENIWITGFLENPLYYSYDEQLLPLPLHERVGSRFDLVITNPLESTKTIPSGTTVTQVFDQAGGELLILGEPGAGKTTLLLELGRDLLKRAKGDPETPIPVVLNLSSWAPGKLPLEQWIVRELQTKYDISSQTGEEWVKANQLLLLLDGLDEIAPSVLPACIVSINEYYHQKHRSLVVCSRTKEFLDQPGRLALHTALIVQPLSSEQVDTYLDRLAAKGEDIKGLQQALHEHAALRALVTTPLYLTVLLLAYHGKPLQELLALVKATPTDQQHLLFHNYIERTLQRKGTRFHAPAQQTKHWLGWLACQMTAHQQSELYLEQIQLDWLPKRQRAFYRWSIGLVFGLLLGLVSGFVSGLAAGLLLGLLIWLATGLVGGRPAGLVLGLAFGLLFGWYFGLKGPFAIGLGFGFLFWMAAGFSKVQLTDRAILSPNAGRRHFLKSGLIAGLVFGLMIGLAFGPLGGLGAGLVTGLVFGLAAALHQYTLGFWLWQARCTPAPWRYVAFLNDAIEQLLLRKIGGVYFFRHRLLQDYFASLEPVRDSTSKP